MRRSLDGAGLDRRWLFFGYRIDGRRCLTSTLRRKRWGCLGLTLSLSRSFRSLFSSFSFKFHLFLQRERRCLRLWNCRTERWCLLKPRWRGLGRTWLRRSGSPFPTGIPAEAAAIAEVCQRFGGSCSPRGFRESIFIEQPFSDGLLDLGLMRKKADSRLRCFRHRERSSLR